MKSKISWITFFLIIIILSYLRESIFISINAASDGMEYNYANTTLPTSILTWALKDVEKSKIILTLLFTVAFMISCLAGIWLSFKNSIYIKMCIALYVIVLSISLFFLLTGFIMGDWLTFYNILRKILSYLNKPLIYLFLSIVAFSNLALKNYD